MRIILLVAVVTTSLVVGCSRDAAHGTSLDPDTVTREWIEAATNKDRDRFLSLMTEAARAGLESDGGFDMTEQAFDTPEVGEATVSDGIARVPVTASQGEERQTFQVQLRQENRAWRVFGIEVPMGEMGSMTVDFETFGSMMEQFAQTMATEMAASFERAQEEHTKREIRNRRVAFESLAPMDRAAFTASWTNDTDFRGRPAAEAITTLARACGLEIGLGAAAEALSKAVTSDVRGLSRLQAIDLIAGDCGWHPVFPSTMVWNHGGAEAEGITFESGARPGSWAHAGPFLARITQVNERVPYARGSVQVEFDAHGLPEGVVGLLDDLPESVRFDPIMDARGNRLEFQEGVRYMGGGAVSGGSYASATTVDLKGLLRSVKSIPAISGVVPVMLPLDVVEMTMDRPKQGTVKKVGALTVTVTQVGSSTSFDITGPEEDLADLVVCSRALDGSGQDIQVHYEMTSQWMPGKAQYQVQTAATPGEIRTKFITRREVIDVPFRIVDVPLQKAAQMPDALAELQFSGNTPVSVRFDGFDATDYNMPNARLTVTNRSSKDVENLQVTFQYLDGKGKVIKEFPHTIQGTHTMEGPRPVALKGEKESVETTAFFRPDGCNDLRIKIDTVIFMDGTRWTL